MIKMWILIFVFLILSPSVVLASGGAPALYGIKGAVIQPVIFANKKIADQCALRAEDIESSLKKSLQSNGVPAIYSVEVNLDTITPAHVDILPEITTLDIQGFDCVSWVSLVVQTNNNVSVPPVDVLRNVIVTYWHDGSLIQTSQALHERTLEDFFQKAAVKFSVEFKNAQTFAGH